MRRIYIGIIVLLNVLNLHGQTFEMIANNFGSSGTHTPLLINYNNQLCYVGYDTVHGHELWITDGTTAGCHLVKDINPSGNSAPFNPFIYNQKLYFLADDGTHSVELWVTDGTETGTLMVKDIDLSNQTFPEFFCIYNNSLYFNASDGVEGAELWVTEGTDSTTHMIKDINPMGSSSPGELVVYNNRLYFSATDGVNGTELWVSDGTDTGTHMVLDINPADSSNPFHLKSFNGKLFFAAKNTNTFGVEPTMYVSDGTQSGTINWNNVAISYCDEFYWCGCLFTMYFPGINNGGSNLWRTDGTLTGTYPISNTNPLQDGSPRFPTDFNGKTFFLAASTHTDFTPWLTDGTLAGTVIIKDSINGTGTRPIVYHDKVYWGAGYQLFTTDGTYDGTNFLSPPGASSYSPLLGSFSFIEMNNSLFFSAGYYCSNSCNTELWKFTTPDVSEVHELELSLFTLFPNPTANQLNITIDESLLNAQLNIYNLTGALMQSDVLKIRNQQFEIRNFPSGVYIVEVKSFTDAVVRKRFVKL